MVKQYLKKQTDYRVEGSIAWKTRNNRMKVFNEYFEHVVLRDHGDVTQKIKIIDVGGTPQYWKYLDFKYIDKVSIISLNLEISEVPEELKSIITAVRGTAVDMSEYDDDSFDLAFSNSVIEHVGDYEDQKKMAREMRRIASHGFCQTPNKFFFMEPHFLIPFFQFLPLRIREELVYRFQVGQFKKAETRADAKKIVNSVHLLSYRKMRMIFPRTRIQMERWLLFNKSFMAYW